MWIEDEIVNSNYRMAPLCEIVLVLDIMELHLQLQMDNWKPTVLYQ